MNNPKTILVPGGAGFLGSNLVERLLKEGNRVIVIDNLITGQQANVDYLSKKDNFEFIDHDITKSFKDIKLPGKVDQIYNCACPASPIDFHKLPFEIIWTNVIGVDNLLELAQKTGARFLQTSTSEVYGEPLEHPQRESYRGNVNTLGPRACYDESKRLAETLVVNHTKKYNTETRTVRIFNTYGVRMRLNDGRVTPNFVKQALENENISVYGDGSQTRSFCYVSDMVDGFIKAMNSGYVNGPINLGNPDEHTILDLASKIINLTNSKSKIIHMDLPKDDPSRRKPDISLAQQKLDWSPKVSLDEGLEKTIKYFREII